MYTSQSLIILTSLLALSNAQFTASTAPELDPTSTTGGPVPTHPTPVPLGGQSTGTISAFGGSVATVSAASSTGMSVAVTGGSTTTVPTSSASEGGAGSIAGGATLMTATRSNTGSVSSTASSTRAGGSSASTAAGSAASATASTTANAAPAYGVGWQVLQGVLVAGGAGVVVAQVM